MTDAESRPSTMSTQFKSSYSHGMSSFAPVAVRALELIVAIICIGFIDDPATSSVPQRAFLSHRSIALAYATFASFIIICGIYLMGKCVKETIPWKSSALIALTGLILFIATAVALFSDWSEAKIRHVWPPNTQRLDFILVTAVLSLINACFFLIDFLYTAQQGIRGNLD